MRVNYLYHRYLCILARWRGELCEPLSFAEFKANA